LQFLNLRFVRLHINLFHLVGNEAYPLFEQVNLSFAFVFGSLQLLRVILFKVAVLIHSLLNILVKLLLQQLDWRLFHIPLMLVRDDMMFVE
jgi:hypothetical protein